MKSKFAEARKIMSKFLAKNRGMYLLYQSNIAMLLYDRQFWNKKLLNFKKYDVRNDIAKEILNLVFSIPPEEKGT